MTEREELRDRIRRLVEKLEARRIVTDEGVYPDATCQEAAATITRLEGERDEALSHHFEALKVYSATLTRADAAAAENARLREALTEIEGLLPTMAAIAEKICPPGSLPTLSQQHKIDALAKPFAIATHPLTGDLTNG